MVIRNCKEWTCDVEEYRHVENIASYFIQQLHIVVWNPISLKNVIFRTAKCTESIGSSVLVFVTILSLNSVKIVSSHKIFLQIYDICSKFQVS